MNEPVEAYDEPYYNGRRDLEPEMNVKWGRVVGLVGALILGLIIGRVTAPEGVPESRLSAVKDELAAAQATITRLETRINASPTPAPAATTTPSPATTAGSTPAAAPTARSTPTPAVTGDQTYTVKPGDSLWSIAKKFYGDATLATFLAEANSLADRSTVRVGQKLRIPPKPASTSSPRPTPSPTRT
ncbi:MAG: LysM peptidoglycan-binding domain-containing protein [Actinomycetota bacterium]